MPSCSAAAAAATAAGMGLLQCCWSPRHGAEEEPTPYADKFEPTDGCRVQMMHGGKEALLRLAQRELARHVTPNQGLLETPGCPEHGRQGRGSHRTYFLQPILHGMLAKARAHFTSFLRFVLTPVPPSCASAKSTWLLLLVVAGRQPPSSY